MVMDTIQAASMNYLIPNKGPATLTLITRSDTPTTITVQVYNAWMVQEDDTLTDYGRVRIEGSKTMIMIMDAELNPQSNGREIRPKDRIQFGGFTWAVTQGGAKRSTVDTVWKCDVDKIFPSA